MVLHGLEHLRPIGDAVGTLGEASWRSNSMSVRFGRSQGFLRLTYLAVLLASSLPRFAIASDASAPIEQLNVGLLQAMKLGQSAPFRQRYDLLAPLVLRAVDLDVILQRRDGFRLEIRSARSASGADLRFPALLDCDLCRAFQRVRRRAVRVIAGGNQRRGRTDNPGQNRPGETNRRDPCARLFDAPGWRRLESVRRYRRQLDQPGRRAAG